jgi:putative resolvase
MDKFVTRKEASTIIGVHFHTINAMAERNELETIMIGTRRLYNVDKFLKDKGVFKTKNQKNICYCRVSSFKQKGDLENQIKFMKNKYPYYEIITDIGSGLNYNRPGLQKILKYAINGELNELVVTYKDRLTRFGYELIEWILKEYSNGKIKIINSSEESTPMEEVSKDILAIMNVYVAKINGLRKYKKLIKKDLKQQ